jgi:glycosyltransferase involved in cell wall biosynthesis
MISVIIPCYLGQYEGAAKDRDRKLKRAIESVMHQVYQDWEIIVIADGCKQTVDIARNYPVRGYYIDKQKMFSGIPRNVGLEKAKGDIVCYLDADDYFGEYHLLTIEQNFQQDWVYFNDFVYFGGVWKERIVQLTKWKCGTSNIAHRPLDVRWDEENKYSLDDWKFIKKLKRYGEKKIDTPQYYVAHIPKKYDV